MFYSGALILWTKNNILPNWKQLVRTHLSNSCSSGPWVPDKKLYKTHDTSLLWPASNSSAQDTYKNNRKEQPKNSEGIPHGILLAWQSQRHNEYQPMAEEGVLTVITPTWRTQPRNGQTKSSQSVQCGSFPAWKNQPRSGQPTSSEGAPLGMSRTSQNKQHSRQPKSREGVHNNNVPRRTF